MVNYLVLGQTYFANSLATTNAAVISAVKTQLVCISANNASAAARFVRFYSKATAPVVGTDIPVMVITVPASSSKEIFFGDGFQFPTGIGVAITSGAAAADATALLAAGDVQLAVNYYIQ